MAYEVTIQAITQRADGIRILEAEGPEGLRLRLEGTGLAGAIGQALTVTLGAMPEMQVRAAPRLADQEPRPGDMFAAVFGASVIGARNIDDEMDALFGKGR